MSAYSDKELRSLASIIAVRLFTNGSAQVAARLVLIAADGRDLGGWGQMPATDQIYDALKRHAALRTKRAARDRSRR